MKVINRIKENNDFAYTIKNSKTIRADSYSIHMTKNEFNLVRVGISVSKKVGNAVCRNRIKRQVRAICDSLIDYNKHSIDLVIIVRRSYLEKTFLENSQLLKQNISNLL